MRAYFDHSYEEAANIRTFWFIPERPLNYSAGQYTELTIKHDDPDERGEKRWFTLSGAPGHQRVSITTKYAGDATSSTFKRALFNLKPGDGVSLAEAMGDFVLPKDASIPLLFIAGGIGITPFHSIAAWLADHDEKRTVSLLYGVHAEAEMVFQNTFAEANIKPVVVVSKPSISWRGPAGQLTAKRICDLAKPSRDTYVYLSGPELMVEALEKDLLNMGVPRNQLIGDFFPGYSAV